MFNRYPYTDFNKINLDWIMRRLKEQVSSAVNSVNGKIGIVTLDANDVGALPDSYTPPVESVNLKTGAVVLDADDVGAFPGAVVISSAGEDIDTYTTQGIWYFPVAYLPTHAPEYATAGFLIVLRGNTDARMVQIWYNNKTDDKTVYVRNNATNTVNWTAWADFATSGIDVVRGMNRKNDPFSVAQFLEVAGTYYDNRQYIQYGNTTFLDGQYVNDSLDCSAFVGLCLRGIKFEDTPLNPNWSLGPQDPTYWVANPDYSWSWNPYDYTVSSGGTGKCRRASQFGKLLASWGMRVVMDDNFANLEPGDIIFYSSKDSGGNYVEQNTWMHISHVGICWSKANTPIAGFPYTHEVIDVSGLNADDVGIKVLETDSRTPFISIVCRPDFGALIPKKPEEIAITLADLSSYFTGTNVVKAYKYDKLVVVQCVLVRDSTAKSTTYRNVATGLPAPALPTSDSLNRIIPLGALYSSDDSFMFAFVNSSGNLRIAGGNPDERYSGTLMYYCD